MNGILFFYFLVLWAIRTSKSSVSGYSSFELLLYGREDMLPTEVTLLNSIEEPAAVERSMNELLLERSLEQIKK